MKNLEDVTIKCRKVIEDICMIPVGATIGVASDTFSFIAGYCQNPVEEGLKKSLRNGEILCYDIGRIVGLSAIAYAVLSR